MLKLYLLSFVTAIITAVFSTANMALQVPSGDVTALKTAITNQAVVELAPNGTYNLTSVDNTTAQYGTNGLPVIAAGRNVLINGNGATIARVAGSPVFRLFYLEPGATLTLFNITLTGGDGGGYPGGAALNNTGELHVKYARFIGNKSAGGGALATVVTGGLAKTYIDHSSFISNTTPITGGGAILNSALGGDGTLSPGELGRAELNVSSSTFSSNQAIDGGAIANLATNGTGLQPGRGEAIATISNSTFNDNTAQNSGGAFFNAKFGTADNNTNAVIALYNSTLHFNQAAAGGHVANIAPPVGVTIVELRNNLFSLGLGQNCYGTFAASGVGNLEFNNNAQTLPATCGVGTTVTTSNPLVDFGDNGGITATFLLTENSVARTGGNPAQCANQPVGNVDQRGVSRAAISDGLCSIGSIEMGTPYIVKLPTDDGTGFSQGSLSHALNSVPAGGAITFDLNTTGGSVTVTGGPLAPVKPGVRLYSLCSALGVPFVTINGSGTPYNGLRLSGNNTLHGLSIFNFGLREIEAYSKGNRLTCVRTMGV